MFKGNSAGTEIWNDVENNFLNFRMHHQTSAKTRKAWHLTLPPFYVPFSSLASFKKFDRSSHARSEYYCSSIFYHCAKILFSELRQVICITCQGASKFVAFFWRHKNDQQGATSFFFEEMESFAMSFALLRSWFSQLFNIWFKFFFLILNAPSWNNVQNSTQLEDEEGDCTVYSYPDSWIFEFQKCEGG
jgi:hypothetical protein